MLKSLYGKLTLAFILVAFLTAALVAFFIRMTSADRLSQLIIDQQRSNLETALQQYYRVNGSWAGVAQSWRQIQFSSLPTREPQPEAGVQQGAFEVYRLPPGGEGREALLGLAAADGTVIVAVDPSAPTGSMLPAEAIANGLPVTVNGEQVGTILTASQPVGFNPQEALFLRRTSQALISAMLAAMLGALILGLILARTLTKPLNALTQAAHNITGGQLEQQVQVTSTDEIGQLARAFNKMSQEVARVNAQRRQMTADIAHDLRTPLTVISGYIESMQDGVLKPTPERLALIYDEIQRLQELVGDLRTLSLADAGELPLNPQPVTPIALLNRAADVFRYQAEQQGVGIAVRAGEGVPEIQVDELRMLQVLDNLISNSLRYTGAGGQIILSAGRSGDGVLIRVQDTGEGIAAEELPYIFHRFHRADKSRHTENNESGLGLAIVKALVEAHGGTVSADSAPGQGTTIEVRLPVDHAIDM